VKGSFRNFNVLLSKAVMAAAVALLAMIYFAGQDINAQTQGPANPVAPRPTRPVPEPAQQRPPAQASPAAPASGAIRTETITYDAWTVSCRDTVDGKSKKICSATLSMVAQQQNQRITIGTWIIARNNEGALLSLVQTPQIDVGVLIAKGVEIKLGGGTSHRINYVDCNPQRCEATMPMDDAVIKEAMAAANGPAAITFWKTDGAEFTISIQSIKGIDKAITAVR
jgi:invasion protein IalB